MPSCPDAILRLIERFDHQLDQVKSHDYNETQLRIDFVNPMFKELGWDIDNRSGYAKEYREKARAALASRLVLAVEALERGQLDLVWQLVEGLRAGSPL